MSLNPPIADLFYRALLSILKDKDGDREKQRIKLRQHFHLFFEEISALEKIEFPTLFSRIAYIGTRYKVDPQLLYWIHFYRRNIEQSSRHLTELEEIQLGGYVLAQSIHHVFNIPVPLELKSLIPEKSPIQKPTRQIVKFKSSISGVIVEIDSENNLLHFIDDQHGENVVYVKYNEAHKNEIFNGNFKLLEQEIKLPFPVNLIDVEIDKDDFLLPAAFVFNPDYLVDVTAVAESFSAKIPFPEGALLRKFLPREVSKYLILGNIANYLLDELIVNGKKDFSELIPSLLKLSPLQFSLLADEEVKEIVTKARMHYDHLYKVIQVEFQNLGIKKEHAFLESSFYSREFGLQGRLDLFHFDGLKDRADIVELKSGKAFNANVYGLAQNHYIQTLLYDLIVKSVYGKKIKPSNYILYSGESHKHLRYAPSVKAQQFEALKIRNEIILNEIRMQGNLDKIKMLDLLNPNNYSDLKGFVAKDLHLFASVYHQMDAVEKVYFNRFVSFIAREHYLAKIGQHGLDKSNGLAAIWLEPIEEKEERFSIISQLEYEANSLNNAEGIIRLNKTEASNQLANFRKGDICVLYPYKAFRRDAVLQHQIFKCAVLEINDQQVVLRLRSKQVQEKVFTQEPLWNIEPDMLDSSFNHHYKSLFAFANTDPIIRQRLLGRLAPGQIELAHFSEKPSLTGEQNLILSRMIQAEDYFLLWGPPGTGKTSVMLHHFVKQLHSETSENILILAYTNRAVDEICNSLNAIADDFKSNYIRIGSKYGVGDDHKEQLLDFHIAKLDKRIQIRGFIDSKRIFVSTVSSILGKSELLDLKCFDTVIIDEASQILEPMLVGLLTKFKRFVLIGDHKQLPAVVVQDHDESSIENNELKALGFQNLRDSLFERLYKQCLQNKWNHAIGVLTAQGRMHQEIKNISSEIFYDGNLRCLEKLERLNAPLDYKSTKKLFEHRVLFVPTKSDESFHLKTNRFEVEVIAELVEQFIIQFKEEGKSFNQDTVGIITPFRAQIALMTKVFQDKGLPDQITIDTVERYQGGARDIIIISWCTNSIQKLNSISSLSSEGVDRKLNVAITRAREQLIMVGNRAILSNNPLHRNLIERSVILEKP